MLVLGVELALVVVVLDVVVPHVDEVELALLVAVAVPLDGRVSVDDHDAVAHEEAAMLGELALTDEDHEVPHCCGGDLHGC